MIDTPTNADYPPQGWLTALARLWLLKPVRSTPSGEPRGAILIMAAVWLLAWVAIDRWQSQPDPQFFPNGIPLLAWYALAILGLAALLRRWARPAPALAGLIEVRGLGIRRLGHEPVAVIGLVVDLATLEADRLPDTAAQEVAVAGIKLPRVAIAPGADPLTAVLACLLTAHAEV